MRITVYGTQAEAIEAARAGSAVYSRKDSGIVSDAAYHYVGEIPSGGFVVFGIGDFSVPDYYEIVRKHGSCTPVAAVAGDEVELINLTGR